jgi:CRP/FNR family transcriptional regulator
MLSADQISGYPLFKDLSGGELEAIASCMVKRFFIKDAYLFHPGIPSINMYIVESGLVRIFFSNTKGDEFLLNLVGPRATFGQPLKLNENNIRILGAAALTPVVVLCISYEDLFNSLKTSRQLSLNLYQDLADSIRKLTLHYQAFITTGLEGRVASLFLHLSESRNDVFNLPISQMDLASWLGASRGRLNRTLIEFQKKGYIHLEGSTFYILDRPALAKLTEGSEFVDNL